MQTVLYIFSGAFWITGSLIFILGPTSLMQIIAALLCLSGTITFASGAIVGAILATKR